MRRTTLLPFLAVLCAALVPTGAAGAIGQGDLMYGFGSVVLAIDANGNTTEGYFTGTAGTNATDIANSSYTADVYVVNSGTGANPSSVSRFLANGTLLDANFGGPFAGRLLCARTYSPILYVSERLGVTNTIYVLDESYGTLLSAEHPPGGTIQGFELVGTVLVYVSSGRLRRYDMSTNSALTDLATPPDTPLGVRRTWEGILVLTSDAILHYDFDGVLIRTYTGGDIGAPGPLNGLGFDYFDETFWTTAEDTLSGGTTAFRIDLQSGEVLSTIGDQLPPILPTGVGTFSAFALQSVPIFDHSSGCGTTRSVMARDTLQFVVTVISGLTQPSVTLTSGPLPPGATMTPPLPVSGRTASSTFRWVPDMSMVGSHQIAFQGAGVCSMTIEVEPNPVGVPDARSTLPFVIHPRRLDDRRLDIEFTLPADEWIVIRALDVHGRQVGSLVRSALPAGRHRIRWDVDSALVSGVYWIELRGRSSRAVGRFVLLR